MRERIAAAVIGTGARPWTPSSDPAHAWLGGSDGPWRLLLEAGIDAVRAQAGWVVPVGSPLPPAGPEHRALCLPEVTALLTGVLTDRDRALIALVLARLAARGRRVPPGLLPTVLQDARVRALPDTWIVGGERALWLAAQHPGWARQDAGALDLEALDEGTPKQRQHTLALWLAQDPDAATAWLDTAWPVERAPIRQAWLALLPEPPPDTAVPLLTAALTDRSRKVRALAGGLLRSLPHSDLAEACAQAGLDCLRWHKGRWEVQLPHAWDPAWGEPPPGPDEGRRTREAAALVACVPLDRWRERAGAEPAACVQALDPQDRFVADAWRLVACRTQATPWLTALLDQALDRGQEGAPFQALIDALPPAVLALRGAEAVRIRAWGQILPLLGALARPWPDGVARAWVRRFHALCQRVDRDAVEPPADALQTVRLAALGLPAALPGLDTHRWIDRLAPTRGQALVAQALDDLEHVLRVRRRLDDLLPGASP